MDFHPAIIRVVQYGKTPPESVTAFFVMTTAASTLAAILPLKEFMYGFPLARDQSEAPRHSKTMNLDKKIEETIGIIRRYEHVANMYGGYSVMFSGGKDSQVMLDLFKKSGVRFRAFYCVTTNDAPENVYFIRKNYPDVEFLHPRRTFLQLIEAKKMLPTIKHRFCCSELKERNGKGIVAVGTRREESAKRSTYDTIVFASKRQKSSTFSEEKMNKTRKAILMPILEWREDEVWQYIDDNNLPVNPCYESEGRVGCMFCPFKSKKALTNAAERYPRYHRLLMRSIQRIIDKGYMREFSPVTADDVWQWWISKENAKTYFKQLKIEFKDL